MLLARPFVMEQGLCTDVVVVVVVVASCGQRKRRTQSHWSHLSFLLKGRLIKLQTSPSSASNCPPEKRDNIHTHVQLGKKKGKVLSAGTSMQQSSPSLSLSLETLSASSACRLRIEKKKLIDPFLSHCPTSPPPPSPSRCCCSWGLSSVFF